MEFNIGIDAVVFDMDGVLLDTESVSEQAWITASREIGSGDAEEMYASCVGMTEPMIRASIERRIGKKAADDFFAGWNREFDKIIAEDGVPVMPYAGEALENLRGKFRLALASSTRGELVRKQLGDAGLLDFFEVVVSGDMVGKGKPDPEIYRTACNFLNLPPEKCAAVEDSPNGIMSAYSAGLKPVMIPDRIKPDEETGRLLWKLFPSLRDLCMFLLQGVC